MMMFPKPLPRKRKKHPGFKTKAKRYCQYCGRTNVVIDPPHHIEFKQLGGSKRAEVHSEDNAITLCRGCHDRAHGIGREAKITKEQLREALIVDR